MQRNDERCEPDLIELGAVSAETRGPGMFDDDHENGKLIVAGLTDD